MKKCPVCGVMMGDNVARCSMCKYDFQKASLGDAEQAIAEAASNLAAKEAENAARVAEKRTEEEKHLLETRARIEKEIASLSETYEREKNKLEAEYQEMQKVALADKERIESELGAAQAELDEARGYATKIRKDADEEAELKRANGQKEYDEMIDLAKKEQQRIITEAQQQTETLAVQVEQEFAEAMKKRDEILAEAKELQDMVDNADQVMADKNKEVEDFMAAKDVEVQTYLAEVEEAKTAKQQEVTDCQTQIDELHAFYDAEKIRLEEEAKRIGMEQANEALRLKEEADAERRAINEEKEAIIADIEQRRVDAQAELDQLVEQAKGVIAEAEEATKTRDEMLVVIEEAKALEAKKSDVEKQIADYEASMKEALATRDATLQEWDSQIAGIKGEYEEAQKVIADAKIMQDQAEAIGQEIIFNAEKQAVALKTLALNESEKGSLNKLLEEKEQQIEAMEKERDELIKEIEDMKASIEDLKIKLGSASTGVATLQDGPKEYSVEVVPHNGSSEVDDAGVAKVLAKKSAEGWKLVSVINDEGGKLQSSLGGAETSSLSTGVYSTKEDRVVLIFERTRQE